MSLLVPSRSLALYRVKVAFKTSTASAWGASFLRHLDVELEQDGHADHQHITDQVCSAAQALFNAHHRVLPGLASFTALGMCALILSAYRVLVVRLGNSAQAFDLVQRSFDLAYLAFITHICKPLYLDANRSPQSLAKMNFNDWSKGLNGEGWSQAGGTRAVVPHAQAGDYHAFFRDQDAPGLSQIILAADQAWAKAVGDLGFALGAVPLRSRASDRGFYPFRFAPRKAKPAPQRPDRVFELLTGAPGTTGIRKGER